MADIKISGKLVNDTDDKLADGSQIMVDIGGSEKSLQSAIDDDDIGGGSELDEVLEKGSGSNAVKMVTAGGASGQNAFAAGRYTQAIGVDSHAEGMYAYAKGNQSHAEGDVTIAAGDSSHAECGAGMYGNEYEAKCTETKTKVKSSTTFKSESDLKVGMLLIISSEVVGYVSGVVSAALKQYTITFFDADTEYTIENGTTYSFYQAAAALGTSSHAEGQAIASGIYSHAEGKETEASGVYSHAEGKSSGSSTISVTDVPAIGLNATGQVVVEDSIYRRLYTGMVSDNGCEIVSLMTSSGVNRVNIKASKAFAGGTIRFKAGSSIAAGEASHTEGDGSVATGEASHAEGCGSVAEGDYSHAEGVSKAAGTYTHAEGGYTIAKGGYSHAEGYGSIAVSSYAHAEGDRNKAEGLASHAEGVNTIAKGAYSHAEGDGTKAEGDDSHAEGSSTITNNEGEHAEGKYNVSHMDLTSANTKNRTRHSVGIGTGDSARKNAHEIMENGDHYFGDGRLMAGDFGSGTAFDISKMYIKHVVTATMRAKKVDNKYYVWVDRSAEPTSDYNLYAAAVNYGQGSIIPTYLATDTEMFCVQDSSYKDDGCCLPHKQILYDEGAQEFILIGLTANLSYEEGGWKRLYRAVQEANDTAAEAKDIAAEAEETAEANMPGWELYNTATLLEEFRNDEALEEYEVEGEENPYVELYDLDVDEDSANRVFDFTGLVQPQDGKRLIRLYINDRCNNETEVIVNEHCELMVEEGITIKYLNDKEDLEEGEELVCSLQGNIVVWGKIPVQDA